MEVLALVRPSEWMLEEIAAYRCAMLEAGSGMDGTGGLEEFDTPEKWLQHIRCVEDPERCPPSLVTATQYVALRKRDNRIVGMIDLRHRLSAYLSEYGGHIGYSVRPDERRHGYVTWMLAAILKEAEKRGMTCLLVTCDADNEASKRTIESCGGVFERMAYDGNTAICRYWIKTA